MNVNLKKMLKYSILGMSLFMLVLSPVLAADAETINCGGNIIDIPIQTAKILHTIYTAIKFITPVVLVFMGLFDFGKSVMAGKEDDIAKNRKKFFRRCIAAVIIILLAAIVEIILETFAGFGFIDGRGCINSIINGTYK